MVISIKFWREKNLPGPHGGDYAMGHIVKVLLVPVPEAFDWMV
jgi:hypothetical protein